MSKTRIAFVGAGNMAASLIGGLRAQGVEASLICASAPGAETRERIATEHGIKVFADNAEAVKGADVVVLAVKPQMMKSVCQALKASLDAHQLIVSVAAGITCASLTQWLGDQPVVRCMPNTPSLLRQGASGLYATEKVSPTQREQAEQLLSAVGVAVWVEQEKHMDAVTAVSGSGPAYFFLMMEAMTAAGVKLGLPEDIAKKLTLQTALGSALIATGSNVDAGELRRRVASPGGTTEAAIKAFQAGGFEALVETALAAADHRAAELAEQLANNFQAFWSRLMIGLNTAAIYVLQTLGSLYLLITLLRFVLQLVRANFYNPLCQFIVRATQPLLKPLRRIIPSLFGLDMSSLVLAIIVQMILMALTLLLMFGTTGDPLHLLLWSIIGVTALFLKIFFFALIISVILSWVAPGSHNPGAELVNQICEPALAPFRKIVPNLGGLDISPILAFLVLKLLDMLVINNLAAMSNMPDVLRLLM